MNVGEINEGQYVLTSPPRWWSGRRRRHRLRIRGQPPRRRRARRRARLRRADRRAPGRGTRPALPATARDEWTPEAAARTGGGNAWAADRGRPGARSRLRPHRQREPGLLRRRAARASNRYANSVVALRASTGEVVWQLPGRAPRPVGLRRRVAAGCSSTSTCDGRLVPAVIQATKIGPRLRAPPRDGRAAVPGRGAAGTGERRPGRARVADAAVPRAARAALAGTLRAGAAWGLDAVGPTQVPRAASAALRYEGIFTPPSIQGTLSSPSTPAGPTGAASRTTRAAACSCRHEPRCVRRRARAARGWDARAARPRPARGRVRAAARHAVRAAPRARADVAARPAVHPAALGRARGRRPGDGREGVAGPARHDPRRRAPVHCPRSASACPTWAGRS